MRNLIMFGRSPFVNTVDVAALHYRYETLGFNHFGKKHPVDYLFSLNEYIEPISPRTRVFGHYEHDSPVGVKKIAYSADTGPCLVPEYKNGFRCYAWYSFSPTAALDWAIAEGFDQVFLVGIDHVETDKRFEHNDGIDDHRGQNMIPELHQRMKSFVYACAQHMEIFQCNPAVKDQWKLPYRSVEDLLS